ncbi:recQ-mediated genome instability protein 1 [Gastrophryne carolinensis]
MTTCAVRVKTWLSSAWHVKVPDPWLEACISWIQEENSGSSLSQAEINKQVFEQWLLTDLRDLQHPVLPSGILESLKCDLSGFYALQVDSLIDVSQPAYSQLQKLKGRENVNDQVTAKTQATQQPWEAKPTRMLMLQFTDGTQNIQGMEYQSVPALHVGLSPGTKILLQGTINCRLGVLLLKPENVKVLGGEVEALVEEYSQGKVLSRLVGVEEDMLPPVQEQNVVRQDVISQALGISDEDLIASLEENDELTVNQSSVPESGYYSRSDNSSYSSSISLLDREQMPFSRPLRVSTDNEPSMSSTRQSSVPTSNERVASSARQSSIQSSNESAQVNVRDDFEETLNLDEELFLEEEIQRELEEMSVDQAEFMNRNQNSSTVRLTSTAISSAITQSLHNDLESPPYTYLSAVFNDKSGTDKEIKLKSFIVTLTSNLTSSSGDWSIKAKISDGTGYLDVEFSNEVLTKLIGFSVTEMKKMKRDPSQQGILMLGLQKCQRELTDFCGIMTICYKPTPAEATVMALQDATEETMLSLRKRLQS